MQITHKNRWILVKLQAMWQEKTAGVGARKLEEGDERKEHIALLRLAGGEDLRQTVGDGVEFSSPGMIGGLHGEQLSAA